MKRAPSGLAVRRFMLAASVILATGAVALSAQAAPVGAAGAAISSPLRLVANGLDNVTRTREHATVDENLSRLAEIMGSLAWLRQLCGAADARAWRDRMAQLLAAEASMPERRDRLAGAYNAGYRAFGYTYLRCTPSAELAIRRYLDEGTALTRALSSRVVR